MPRKHPSEIQASLKEGDEYLKKAYTPGIPAKPHYVAYMDRAEAGLQKVKIIVFFWYDRLHHYCHPGLLPYIQIVARFFRNGFHDEGYGTIDQIDAPYVGQYGTDESITPTNE